MGGKLIKQRPVQIERLRGTPGAHSFICFGEQQTTGKRKGRELVAPFAEAPRSALRENAPSRADWRALGLDLSLENSRFSAKTVAVLR
jgi:hypothetical protein